MSHTSRYRPENGDGVVEYAWGSGQARCVMRIEARGPRFLPGEGSLGQFITEHYWGYAAQRDGGCLEYEVQHPRWYVRQAKSAGFSGDATRDYGVDLAEILLGSPDSAFLAEGSAVAVLRGVRIV